MEDNISLKELHLVRRPLSPSTIATTTTGHEMFQSTECSAQNTAFALSSAGPGLHVFTSGVIDPNPSNQFEQYLRKNILLDNFAFRELDYGSTNDDAGTTDAATTAEMGQYRYKRAPITVRLNLFYLWCCGALEDPATTSDIVALTDPAFVTAIARRQAIRDAAIENRLAKRRLRQQRQAELSHRLRSRHGSTVIDSSVIGLPSNTLTSSAEQTSIIDDSSTLQACGKIAALQQLLGGDELARRHGRAMPKTAPFLRRQSNKYQVGC